MACKSRELEEMRRGGSGRRAEKVSMLRLDVAQDLVGMDRRRQSD